MGRSRNGWRPAPHQRETGVAIRENGKGGSLETYFLYRGIRCRETLKLEVTKENYAYAARLRAEIINQIERGAFRYGDYFPHSPRARLFGEGSSKATVGEIIDTYLGKFDRAVQLGNGSRGTLRVYRGYARALKDEMGSVLASDLAPYHLRQFIDRRECAPKTIRNTMSFLRIVVGEAIEDGTIKASPFAGIDLRRAIKKVAVESEYEVDPFTPDERAAFLAACPTDEERDMYAFWFDTGLRPSELIMLDWSKVDEQRRPAIVRIDTAAAERQEKGPKTKAGIRDVQLTETALDALSRQRARALETGGRIWRSPKFEAPWIDATQLRRSSYRHIIKKAGIRWRHPYQVRHTYASTHCSKGTNLHWLAKQMGHKTIEVLMRHYSRWIDGVVSRPEAMTSAESAPNFHAASTPNADTSASV
jgi:integrase